MYAGFINNFGFIEHINENCFIADIQLMFEQVESSSAVRNMPFLSAVGHSLVYNLLKEVVGKSSPTKWDEH